jgi:hypothetical protein
MRKASFGSISAVGRWVGLGVIADNIINIGRAMEKQPDL